MYHPLPRIIGAWEQLELDTVHERRSKLQKIKTFLQFDSNPIKRAHVQEISLSDSVKYMQDQKDSNLTNMSLNQVPLEV